MIIRFALILLLGCCMVAYADTNNTGATGDQGNGTYKNPILPGDFSDPDVIRVGDTYYLVTSTFQYSPGITILSSKDMVNWHYAGHALDDISQIGDGLAWNKMSQYGKGIYACSIRYHDGRFWIYTTTLKHGMFMTSAPSIEGPWEPPTRISEKTWCDDNCPFWDDDGQGYLVYSDISKGWFTHLVKMSTDGKSLDFSTDKVIDDFHTSEGNKIYKIKDAYYVFHNEVRGPGNRVGMMMRSKNIWGPYEKKEILHGTTADHDHEPNQGALVEAQDGSWWFFTHQGNGNFEGRATSLLPVQWIDGWPIPGRVDETGAGNLIWTRKKPILGESPSSPQSSDEFDKPQLGLQWEWNYQPRADRWSLTERPGWLRLHAYKPLPPSPPDPKKPTNAPADPFYHAGNTLTQRVMGYQGGEVIAKFDLSGMTDGQNAGLALFYTSCCRIGVVQHAGQRVIELSNHLTITKGPVLKQKNLWLKAEIDPQSPPQAIFFYSLDGKDFVRLGDSFTLGWGAYRGTRIALYSYNTESESGFVDVDWLHYVYPKITK